jgi:hypothetical protein
MIVASEADEQAPSSDLLPLSCPEFDDRQGNSTIPGAKRPLDSRLDTSEETVAQYQSFSPNASNVSDGQASARGLFRAGTLAQPLWESEAGSLSLPGFDDTRILLGTKYPDSRADTTQHRSFFPQESSGVNSDLALERQYALGGFSEDTLLSSTELSSPGLRAGFIKNRVASEAHLKKAMGRREKEATFFCDWPNCGQSFTAKHNLNSAWSFLYYGDFILTLWN